MPRTRKLNDINSIILHQTGARLFERAEKAGIPPYFYAIDFYKRARYAPHFVLSEHGYTQIAPLEKIQWHTGSSNKNKYWDIRWIDLVPPQVRDDWREFCPFECSPMHLNPWKNGSPNSVSIGIEIVPPEAMMQRRPDQYDNDIPERIKTHLDALSCSLQDTVGHGLVTYTHSQLDPIGRGSKGGFYDLDRNWSRFLLT